jgi:hypothetical protein
MKRVLAYMGIALALLLTAGAVRLSLLSTRTAQPMSGVIVAAGTVALRSHVQTAGGEVVIDRVLAPAASWVVVRTPGTAPTGAMGAAGESKMLGFAHVSAGVTRNVVVELDPTIRRGRQLWAILQADRGAVGRFEFDMSRFLESPDKPYFVAARRVGDPSREVSITIGLQ